MLKNHCDHACEPFALASGVNRMPLDLATLGPNFSADNCDFSEKAWFAADLPAKKHDLLCSKVYVVCWRVPVFETVLCFVDVFVGVPLCG